MSEKKFCPKLYPTDREINKIWFIKYKVEDFINGGYKHGKYQGALNRVPDLENRLNLANEYIAAIKRGEPLQNYSGIKNIQANGGQKPNTNVIQCCKNYIKGRELEDVKPKTISLYNSRINVFELWLNSVGKSHLAIGGVDLITAREFLTYLKKDKGLKGKTFNDYKCLLGSIWHEYRKYIADDNPWREIKGLRKQTTGFKKYPVDLQIKIRQTLPVYDQQLWLFVQCIYYCGFRPNSELRLMKVKDLRYKTGVFFVPEEIGKGYKARRINIYHKLLEQFTERGWHLYEPDFYLFSKNGQPGPIALTETYFDKLWSKYRMAQDIDPIYKLYGNKHTGGRKLTLQTGAYITKEHFGHTTIEQTQEYIDDDELSVSDLQFLQKSFPEYAE